MELKFSFLLIFATNTLGQALLSVLATHLELSTFTYYVNASTSLTNLLSSANNFTLLAPSNTAFEQWFSSQSNPSLNDDVIETTLFYHLLRGGFPTASFTNESQFVASHLTNATYSNVTGGQRVELVTGTGDQQQFISGNKTVSGIVSPDNLCMGGLFHIINQVLSIPLGLVLVMGEAHWNFFVGIINKGGYLTTQDTPLISKVLFSPNMTFFSPNTAEALASFTKTTAGMSQDDLAAVFNYHIVPDFLGYSSVLETGMVLPTVQGDNLTITKIGSDTFVNGAKIINPDFLVANGVVHLIDSILDRFNTSAPDLNTTAAPTVTAKPASKHSLSSAAKIGIGVSVVLALIFLATFIFLFRFLRQRKTLGQVEERPSLLPCFGGRKASERPPVRTEGSSVMRFLRKRTMSNRLSNTNGQYIRQVDSRGKANQILGQDFELEGSQIPSNKVFEVSAVELDAGSLHGRPR